jgi:hypothetical protein
MSQELPFTLALAPFPEGFQGDLDETFQQAYQNTTGIVEGNFITGLILPPNSTLPTSDQGPIAMNETWYFWDATTGKYQPQTAPFKAAKNFVRNCCYQVQQLGSSFSLAGGVTPTYDLVLSRTVTAGVLSVAVDVGPVAGAENDLIPSAIKYTVGTVVATLAATDIYTHEHLIEGSDVVMLQGQQMTLSFFAYATVAGTYSAYITNNGRDQSFVSTFTLPANQWTRIKIANIPAFPTTGTWNFSDGVTGLYLGIPMGVGSQWQTATLNSWQSGFFAGSSANNNMLTVTNNQLKLTGLKLEAAPGATYLQVPGFGTDFEDVQRYYYCNFDYQSSSSGVPMTFVAQAAAGAAGSWGFPRRMAKVPTVVPYSTASPFAAGNLRNLTTSADVVMANLTATRKGTYILATTGGGAKGDVLAAYIRADARIS